MIVMGLELDNFVPFKNFKLNMSYPKKIVGSYIEDEFLKNRPNFRYKKINILMGANATGKTSIGKILMAIFNFMDKKQYEKITKYIDDINRTATFVIDFVSDEYMLYRVKTRIAPKENKDYQVADIDAEVKSIVINARDSYESCIERLEMQEYVQAESYIQELEKIKGISWMFQYPLDEHDMQRNIYCGQNSGRYLEVLTKVLKVLDPAIERVEKLDALEDTFIVCYHNQEVLVKKGRILNPEILSSGTKEGLEVATMLTSILEDEHGFYYCDEKFSYIHSDVEKAVLSVMINRLKDNDQLFFTTHNIDILDLPLPKHSFTFLKKDIYDEEQPIKCISASALLKRNTDSLKHAVENDLFSTAPNIDGIYELADL